MPAELEVTARTQGRQPGDGPPPPDAAHPRRAVSSRVGADQRRPPHSSQLPRDVIMFPALIEKLRRQEDLTTAEAAAAMAAIMRGEAAPAQIAGLLVGLAMKGERPSRAGRPGADHARQRRGISTPAQPGPCSTPAAPAAIAPAPSTSRPRRRSCWPPAAPGSPSTATGRSRASAAAPTSSRRLASTSRPRRTSRRSASPRSASRSSSRRRFIRP